MLYNTKISGTVPSRMWENMTTFMGFYLSDTRISGTIEPEPPQMSLYFNMYVRSTVCCLSIMVGGIGRQASVTRISGTISQGHITKFSTL